MLLPRRLMTLGTLSICLVVVVLASAINTVNARRSRIDLPIKNPADAPLEDNLATATGNESEVVPAVAEPLTSNKEKDPPSPPATDAPISDTKEESSTDLANDIVNELEEDDKTEMPPDVPTVEDCEPDNIGYEIVTGYDFSLKNVNNL